MVVLEAGEVMGKSPWEMSVCLALPRQVRELDLAAHMGTFEFCTVVGTTLSSTVKWEGYFPPPSWLSAPASCLVF